MCKSCYYRAPRSHPRRIIISGKHTGNGMSAPIDPASNITLAPAGLSENDIERVLHERLSHATDSADLYFQTSRHESWGLEDGSVKSGSHSIERGVGVRAVSGEKTGFAYSDEIVLPALTQAAGAGNTISSEGQERHER